MNFGQALEALKSGSRVARAGWNGKGMWLYLLSGLHLPDDVRHIQSAPPGTPFEPCIVMVTAQGKHQPGWNPSTPDQLADDWVEVP
jgi:hypothetical protein